MKSVLFYSSERGIVPRGSLGQVPNSGTVYSLVHVAHALAELGVAVAVVADLEEERRVEGVHYIPCPNFESMPGIIRHWKDGPVVVVGHAVFGLTDAVADFPEVHYWLHNWNPPGELFRQIERFRFRRVICVSPYHLGYYLVHALRARRHWSKLTAIENPVDVSAFTDPPRAPVLDGSCVKVAFIGYPSKGKGFDKATDFVQAAAALAGCPIELHVFGDSSLYHKSGAEYDVDLKVYPHTVLYGSISRSRLYGELRQCHFAVSGLSGSETFCLSLLEAAASGVVPVTLNSGGQVSFFDRRNSVIADRLTDLPGAFLSVLQNPGRYEALSNAARALPHRFAPARTAERWRDVLGFGGRVREPVSRGRVLAWFLRARCRRFLANFGKPASS